MLFQARSKELEHEIEHLESEQKIEAPDISQRPPLGEHGNFLGQIPALEDRSNKLEEFQGTTLRAGKCGFAPRLARLGGRGAASMFKRVDWV